MFSLELGESAVNLAGRQGEAGEAIVSGLDNSQTLTYLIGGLALIFVLLSPGLFRGFFVSPGKKPSELIPAAEEHFISAVQSMAAVRQVLVEQRFSGCAFRVTYDKVDEGRIQARLYGTPAGADKPVDVLVNMLFHRLEPNKTEVEWSYVVMSRQSSYSDNVVQSCNEAIRAALKAASEENSAIG